MSQATHLYAVALGSNRRHVRHGRPAGVIEAAIARLDANFILFDASPIILNKAVGGAGRDFANAVALVESELEPPAMLAELKRVERDFGRRPGRRWGERVLDLDLVAGWRPFSLTPPDHPPSAARRARFRGRTADRDRARLENQWWTYPSPPRFAPWQAAAAS